MKTDQVLATGDAIALNLLNDLLGISREHFSTIALGRGDGIVDIKSALYALNRHLQENHSALFPNGFFVGSEAEVHDFVGKLLTEIYQNKTNS